MDGFTELEVWKRSCRLCERLYKSLADSQERGFKDQITRAALSVPSNIAEGYERESRAEFIRFLYFAKGSSGEIRTQLYIGSRIGVFGQTEFADLVDEIEQISKMLQGLINRLRDN